METKVTAIKYEGRIFKLQDNVNGYTLRDEKIKLFMDEQGNALVIPDVPEIFKMLPSNYEIHSILVGSREITVGDEYGPGHLIDSIEYRDGRFKIGYKMIKAVQPVELEMETVEGNPVILDEPYYAVDPKSGKIHGIQHVKEKTVKKLSHCDFTESKETAQNLSDYYKKRWSDHDIISAMLKCGVDTRAAAYIIGKLNPNKL